MGNIPPCQEVEQLVFGCFGNTILTSCARWAAPHITSPFLIAVVTRSPWLGFAIAGVFEIVEALFVTLFNDFIIFVGDSDPQLSGENLFGAILEDWLIQGGIGTLLAWLFIMLVPGRALVQGKDLRWDRTSFNFYFVATILYFVIYPIFPVLINDEFPIGQIIVMVYHLIWIWVVMALENRFWPNKWRGVPRKQLEAAAKRYYGQDKTKYTLVTEDMRKTEALPERNRLAWWYGIMAIIITLTLFNTFDWFYGNHPQSWIVSGVMVIAMSSILIIRAKEARQPPVNSWGDIEYDYYI